LRIILYWENKRLRDWEKVKMLRNERKSGVFIEFWLERINFEIYFKKKIPAGTTGSADTGTDIDLMWTGGKFFENFQNLWNIDLLNCYNVSANCYNDSETIITVQKPCNGYAGAGTGTTGFFLKKTNRPFSNPYLCTRLPAYIRARVRIPWVPGTDTRIWVVPDGF
jgi:hypothetical protein